MAEPVPIARSPIAPPEPVAVVAGWEVTCRRSDSALTITDCTPLTKVAIRAPWNGATAATLTVPFGRAVRQTWQLDSQAVELLLIGSGPGEWLVLAPPGHQAQVADRLDGEAARDADRLVTVVDITHGRAIVRLTGAGSVDVLTKECGIDLADEMCPDGAALRADVAGLATDLVRDDRVGIRSYLLHCERASGQYLFDSLLDAGNEFGIEADGFVPPGI